MPLVYQSDFEIVSLCVGGLNFLNMSLTCLVLIDWVAGFLGVVGGENIGQYQKVWILKIFNH